MQSEFDVSIIGAGPAGSMAARAVAAGGLSCVVVDKQASPGQRLACAGGIDGYLFHATPIEPGAFIKQRITSSRVYFGDERYRIKHDSHERYVVCRRAFDRALAAQAEAAGAELRLGTKLTSLERQAGRWVATLKARRTSQISARFVIGADGPLSTVARLMQTRAAAARNAYLATVVYELEDLAVQQEHAWHFIFHRSLPGGYAWLFPMATGTANVGAGFYPGQGSEQALRDLMARDPMRQILGTDAPRLARRGGGLLPVGGVGPAGGVAGDAALLAGDAAGIVDVMLGEGIAPAVLSGLAAGETAVEALQSGRTSREDLAVYVDRWRQKRYPHDGTLGDLIDEMAAKRSTFYAAFAPTASEAGRRQLITSVFA